MTKENTLAVNPLPSPTWNRLHMNETTVTLTPLDGPCKGDWSGAEVTAAPTPATVVSTGMGQEAEAAFASLETDRITAKANTHTTARLTLCADGRKNARRVELTAEANSHLTVVMDLQSTADAPCLALETRVELAPGAKVRLVQLSLPGTDCTVVNNIGAHCGAGADFQLVQLFLGGKATYAGCKTHLDGDDSRFTADIGYLGTGDRTFDFNYDALQTGRRTVSNMNADGVLQDRSAKLFRGTIDFQKGAAGSKGDEKEDVLLLGEDVVNRTIPLILCAEEDVEGNHGASIGQLDEDILFYMNSRGLSRAEAELLITRSKLEALCAKANDPGLTDRVHRYLEENAQ